jgi:numb-like protein
MVVSRLLMELKLKLYYYQGERLSHAVGIAFSICLERKQQREVDCGVSMAYNESDGTFTKYGSFRQGTIHERIQVSSNS